MIAARDTDHNLVIQCQWSAGNSVSILVVCDHHIPQQFASLCVQRKQVGVQRAQENGIVEDRHPTVVDWGIVHRRGDRIRI